MAINGFHTAKVIVNDSWKRLTDDSTIVITGNMLIRVSNDNKNTIWMSNNTTTKTNSLIIDSPFPLHPGDFFTMRIRHPYDVYVMTDSNKDHFLWWMTV